jgi:adenosylcobyric acid synthase
VRAHQAEVEATLDSLAAHIEKHLDVSGLLGLAR